MREGIALDDTRPHVTALCPFCNGTYTAAFTTEGDGVVLHTEPYCERFGRLDVNDFLQAARLAGAVPLS